MELYVGLAVRADACGPTHDSLRSHYAAAPPTRCRSPLVEYYDVYKVPTRVRCAATDARTGQLV